MTIVNGYNGDGFKALSKDIQRTSVLSGSHIFKNGLHPVRRLKLSKVQKFCCAHSRRYVSQQKSKTLSTPYRKSTYYQNRKNGRGPDGPKMSKRTSTIKPSLIANTCKYSFFVHFDDNGFYVINGIGNTNHNSHPILGQKEIQVPVRLLQEVDTQFISDMGNGAASGSVIRNILFVKTGRHVSKKTINYMTKTVQQLQ